MHRRTFLKFAALAFMSPGSVFSSGLEDILTRDYGPGEEIAQRNNQHIAKYTDTGLLCKLLAPNNLKKAIYEKLCSMEHTYYRNGRYDTVGAVYNGNRDIFRANMQQLARIHLAMSGLGKDYFRQEIWRQVQLDLEDAQVKKGYLPSERGGFGILNRGWLFLQPVLDVNSTRKTSKTAGTNGYYAMPAGLEAIVPHVLLYHLHATNDDCSRYCGPSFSPKEPQGDIAYCRWMIDNYGDAHNLVITKLAGERFNVGYYGGVKGGQILVLSLGDYSI